MVFLVASLALRAILGDMPHFFTDVTGTGLLRSCFVARLRVWNVWAFVGLVAVLLAFKAGALEWFSGEGVHPLFLFLISSSTALHF